jgi:transcriptional regulator GlxA family with amidase domain
VYYSQVETPFLESPTDAARAAAAFAFVGRRAAGAGDRDRRPAALAGAIRRSRGRISVADLGRRAGLSARQIERIFRDGVGFGPKRLARIVRFQNLLSRIGSEPGEGWAGAAVECGCFDQSHLVRDFREISGRAPSVLADGQGDLARHFTSRERLASFFS